MQVLNEKNETYYKYFSDIFLSVTYNNLEVSKTKFKTHVIFEGGKYPNSICVYLYAAFSQLEYSCLKVALLFPESRKARTGTLLGQWGPRWHRGGLTLRFHLRKWI